MTLLLYELPSGNPVDGLPLAAIAKRRSRRPRTTALLTMKFHLSECDCFEKYALESCMKFQLYIAALDGDSYTSKFQKTSEFYPHEIFHGGDILEIFFRKNNNFRFFLRRWKI